MRSYIPWKGKRFVSSPKCPEGHCDPHNFLCEGYRWLFLLGKSAWE